MWLFVCTWTVYNIPDTHKQNAVDLVISGEMKTFSAAVFLFAQRYHQSLQLLAIACVRFETFDKFIHCLPLFT